jgi:hypothetical protein
MVASLSGQGKPVKFYHLREVRVRHFVTFLSLIAVVAATGVAVHRRLPWPVLAYLSAQSVFALVGWWVLQRSEVTTRTYLLFFATFGAVLCAALLLSLSWPMSFWTGMPLILSLAAAVTFAAARIYRPMPSQLSLSLVHGAILLFCGILTLLALSEKLSPELRYVAADLGVFWIVLGGFAWCHVVNPQVHANDFFPPMLAIAMFGWLAFQLWGMQGELSHQPIRGMAVAHAPVYEGER